MGSHGEPLSALGGFKRRGLGASLLSIVGFLVEHCALNGDTCSSSRGLLCLDCVDQVAFW